MWLAAIALSLAVIGFIGTGCCICYGQSKGDDQSKGQSKGESKYILATVKVDLN